jgi:hypothetical protein
MDLKHLPALRKTKSYVFAAIERATRFVHAGIVLKRDAKTIAACLERFLKAFGHPVHTILTGAKVYPERQALRFGSGFTNRFAADMKDKPEGKPSGRHPFDKSCAANGIKHKLTRPFKPQTNGMAERFNRRIAEAIQNAPAASRNGGKNKFDSHDERNAFIQTFVQDYNRTRLRCLRFLAPSQALANQPGHNMNSIPGHLAFARMARGGSHTEPLSLVFRIVNAASLKAS